MTVVERNRVAIISSSAGALANFRGPLIAELCRRGFTVGAFAPDFTPQLRAAVEGFGAETIDYQMERTGTSLRHDARSVVSLTRLLRRYRPHTVLSHFMKPVIYGTMAAAVARVPHRYAMIEGLGYAFTDTGQRSVRQTLVRRILKQLLRTALRRTDRVIFLNDDDRTELVGAGIAPADRSAVLGGIGLQLQDFAFVPTAPSGPPVFLMIGRLILEKGVFDFVEAARRMRATHPEARFVLVGGLDPKPGALTLSQVQTWVDEGVIEWPGEIADVRPYLRESTVYVLPSYREGVPRSTQEAMAIGRAVITTDVPGCRATVIPEVNGLLVPPRDPAALATAMATLAEDREQAIVMGRESRRIAEERFDVDKVNARLIGIMNL